MAKVAIKNVNITSFGGIYHIMDVFSKLGFEKLTESVLGKRGSSGKAFCYGSVFCGYHTSPLVWVGDFMLRKEPRNTEAPHINIQSPKKISQHIKFSHKKKYFGIKDIRVLFYSSIFQMIIVFPFIVLKYFSFCCHSSHSFLCCNRLVYSCFILIVKSDSKLILNSSCQLSILFNLFVTHLCLCPVFFIYITLLFLFQIVFCSFFMHSVFPVTLSLFVLFFLLLCLFFYSVFPYSVFPVTFFYVTLSFLLFCLYFILFLLCLSVSFHLFVALPPPLFPLSFWLHFYPFICLFFDIFA